MPDPLRSAEIYETVALMAAMPGRPKKHWAIVLENGLPYKWVPDDATTADGFSVVTGTGGGYAGRWLHVPGDQKGTDLDDSDETIVVGGKLLRYLPTLARNSVKTLGTTGAIAGQVLTIVCTSSAAFTLTIVNGGAGAGTLMTKPVSERYMLAARFNGTNWEPRAAGKLP
jgi:hypothetical protein